MSALFSSYTVVYFILLTESKSTMKKKFSLCIILMGCSISTYMHTYIIMLLLYDYYIRLLYQWVDCFLYNQAGNMSSRLTSVCSQTQDKRFGSFCDTSFEKSVVESHQGATIVVINVQFFSLSWSGYSHVGLSLCDVIAACFFPFHLFLSYP